MISVYLPAQDGCWDETTFPSIEDAQEALERLDAELDEASSHRASFIKDAMFQLEEAISEAQFSAIEE